MIGQLALYSLLTLAPVQNAAESTPADPSPAPSPKAEGAEQTGAAQTGAAQTEAAKTESPDDASGLQASPAPEAPMASPPLDLGAPIDLGPLYEEGDLVERNGQYFVYEAGELVRLDPLNDEEDDLITEVTGSRIDDRKNPVVSSTVIESKQIRELGARTLSDVLRVVPGMQITASNGTGENVSIDGMDSKYVLILIDGKPVNGQTNDRVDISRLPIVPSDIKRIEIVRGPQSALYGSEALGGVVNIITKRPKSGVHGEAGYFTRLLPSQIFQHGLQLSASGGLPGVLFRIGATGLLQDKTDRAGTSPSGGLVIIPDGAYDLPYRRQATVNAELSFYPTDRMVIRPYARASWSELDTRQAASIARSEHTLNTQFQLGTQIQFDVYTGHTITFDARADRFTHRFDRIPLGAVDAPVVPFCEDKAQDFTWRFFDPECPRTPVLNSDAIQDDGRAELRYTGELLSGLPLVDQLRVSAGGIFIQQRWDRKNGDGQDTLPGNNGRRQIALYGEMLYQPFSWWTILAGGRLDLANPGPQDTLIAWAPGPKISTRLMLPLNLIGRLSYASGFRLPSFQEQFLRFDHSDVGYIVEGNNALQSEYSHGFRGGLGWTSPFVNLNAEGFLNIVQNAINFDYVRTADSGVPVYTYVNLDRVTTAGANLSLSVPETYGVSGRILYQWLPYAHDVSACPESNPIACTDAQGAKRLPIRPEHNATLEVRYRILATGTSLFSYATATSQSFNDLDLIPANFILRAGVTQNLFDHAELTVAGENLLDAYQPQYGPKPGRSVSANLRAWF